MTAHEIEPKWPQYTVPVLYCTPFLVLVTFPGVESYIASEMSCDLVANGGTRLWTCVLCSKSCNRKANLREHIMAVHLSTGAVCPYADCGTLCRSGPALRMHIKRKHDTGMPL